MCAVAKPASSIARSSASGSVAALTRLRAVVRRRGPRASARARRARRSSAGRTRSQVRHVSVKPCTQSERRARAAAMERREEGVHGGLSSRARRRLCATRCRRSARRRARAPPGRRRSRPGSGRRRRDGRGARARGRGGRSGSSSASSHSPRPPVSSRQRGSSSAACGSRPRSTRCETTCRCPCGCMCPPITPNGPSSAPSRSSRPGMIVWYGRLPGASRLGWPGLEREAVPAVLQRDAGAGRDDERAEAVVHALDQRAGVAVLVDRAQVDRAARLERARPRARRRAPGSISARRDAR